MRERKSPGSSTTACSRTPSPECDVPISLFDQEALAHAATYQQSDSNQRKFLQATALGVATTALAATDSAAARVTNAEGIPMRPLGRTGEMVTMICLGGYHSSVHPNEMDRPLQPAAIDEGITFLDNAWDYHDAARLVNGWARRFAREPPREGLPHDHKMLRPQPPRTHNHNLKTASGACAPTTWTSGNFTKSSTTTTPDWISRRGCD